MCTGSYHCTVVYYSCKEWCALYGAVESHENIRVIRNSLSSKRYKIHVQKHGKYVHADQFMAHIYGRTATDQCSW